MRKDLLLNNEGSGLSVILYGITLLLILLFTAVNIVNSKVIENGYNSLRDAVQTASSGSVIHLLTTNRTQAQGATQVQVDIIEDAQYDIYLQLALGYLINRDNNQEKSETIVQTGEINNFIKLDHQKVVNSTLAVLQDAVVREKKDKSGNVININDTDKYKIMMFFIEPYETKNHEKYFDIIAYGNGDYEKDVHGNFTIKRQLAKAIVRSTDIDKGQYDYSMTDMEKVYHNVEAAISSIVNCTSDSGAYQIDYAVNDQERSKYGDTNFWINLNSSGSSYDQLIREMETYPHYLIVVKDFALPTIFDGNTNDTESFIKRLFPVKDEPTLKKPMCALNTGKIQRQIEEAGWSKNR